MGLLFFTIIDFKVAIQIFLKGMKKKITWKYTFISHFHFIEKEFKGFSNLTKERITITICRL